MKIPVIQLQAETNGFMDYLTPEISYLCKDVRYEKADEDFWRTTSEYYEDCTFAFGNVEELKNIMQIARRKNDKKNNSAFLSTALQVSKDWQWNKSIKNLNKILMSF
jgi:hypothetical protein